MQRIIIQEHERKEILRMYGLIKDDFIRPLQKLMECKISSDGKYIVYEGRAYRTDNGKEVPINEEWTLSDILHAGADVLSAGLDFVIPGSGAVVDTLNALSYVIEAQFKTDEEKDSLYIMAIITFAFVILPGPLQAIAIPLKRAIKTGAGMTSKVVVEGLKIIGGVAQKIFSVIPTYINKALKSPLAKKILGSYGSKISGFITSFVTRTKQLLGSITVKTGKEGAEKAVKQVSEDAFKKSFTIPKNCVSVNFCDTKNILKNLMNIIPSSTIFNPSKVKLLSKSNVAGREVIEVQLENGSKTLFYKSSGANVGTTGKRSGEWFVIPGFAESGWFVKTSESINLVRGGNKYLTEMSKFLEKNGIEGLSKSVTKSAGKNVAKASITKAAKTALTNFFNKLPKITKGSFFLRRCGFVKGKAYRYIGPSGKAMTATIKEITDNGVSVVYKIGKKETSTMVPVETFVKNAIGAPWMRRGYSVAVPLFIKRVSDVVLPDGNIDYAKLEQLPDLDPNLTSQESLEYLQEEVSSYEGESKNYSVNQNVISFQTALYKLGYNLPISCGRTEVCDGKFGPETKAALEGFQNSNNLTSSLGKMDRLTARKLSETLKNNNVQDTSDLQSRLNSI